MNSNRGFTLLELLIATAIMIILGVLATTAYGRYAFRARRSEGQHALMTVVHREERWFTTYNRYTDELPRLGLSDGVLSPRGYYQVQISMEGEGDRSFVALATPIHAQSGDACGTLRIDNRGHKFPAHDDTPANTNGSCW